MAVVTKFKIYNSGRFDAGNFFVVGITSLKLEACSYAQLAGLDVTVDQLKFTSEGVAVANEFREV